VITQIIQHTSLDQEREGLIAALADAGYQDGKTITLIYQNAQGSMPTAVQIGSSFTGKNPTVAVAISTPSAQTLLKPMADQQIPLVFTAVTDPIDAKLVSNLDPRPENVTGVSDALPMRPQLEMIKKLIPNLQTLGVIYNTSESNSVKAVEQLQAEAQQMGLTLDPIPAATPTAVVATATQLVGKKVDAIFIPNDNTAVAAMESIVSIGKSSQIPVFAGDSGSVERGAIAAQAYDRTILGRKAGSLVVKILQGARAGDLRVETDHPLVLMINPKSAQEMGVSIPDDILKQAQIIGDGA
jgi:putative ABC transport system substrate-binding protein